ncbi:MAG TPA: YbaY family lipoprotein [Burkholderiaceae bacterium]|nr:YbaY family lipoprotein [Burkholderiaceae bacterium]
MLAACLTAKAEPTATVRGEVTYRERFAVPPGTQLEVLLLDVSRADAPSQTISGVTLTDVGQPPYPFEVAYRPDQIISSHQYVVRARLTHGGQLLFTTDQTYPVITAGHPTEVQLLLKRVGAPTTTSMTGSDRDEHGCIGSAGYAWCAKEGKCVRPWELAKEKGLASTEEAFRAYCSGTR